MLNHNIPTFERSMLNIGAKLERTHTHTQTHIHTQANFREHFFPIIIDKNLNYSPPEQILYFQVLAALLINDTLKYYLFCYAEV